MAAQNTYISLVSVVCVLMFCGSGVLCAPLCLVGDFDSQLQRILHTQMLSAQDPIISRALDDVRATLNQRWQGYELTLCGSLAASLGTIASDIDLVVQLPNFNDSAGLYVLEETAKWFNKQPELYSRLRYRHNVNIICTFLSFYHIPSKRFVEIEFHTAVIYIQSSNIIRYYFELDKRFQALGIFLKYWFRIHNLSGHGEGYLPGHGLYLLIIFYLQQKNMAPPGYVLQVNSNPQYFDDWNFGFNQLPYSTTNTENLHQLLGGFFKYYSEFNFEEYIVSPFTGRPIPRNDFEDVDKFLKEYTLFNHTINRTMQLAIKSSLDTEVSIQDIFFDDSNAGHMLSHERVTKFKYLMKSMATMFEDLPRDRILRAILVTDEHKEPVINHNNADVDGISAQNCIEIADPHER